MMARTWYDGYARTHAQALQLAYIFEHHDIEDLLELSEDDTEEKINQHDVDDITEVPEFYGDTRATTSQHALHDLPKKSNRGVKEIEHLPKLESNRVKRIKEEENNQNAKKPRQDLASDDGDTGNWPEQKISEFDGIKEEENDHDEKELSQDFVSDDEETSNQHDMKDPPQEFESDDEETDNRHDMKNPTLQFESDDEEADNRHDMKDSPQEFESDVEEAYYRRGTKNPPHEFESDDEETDNRHCMKDPTLKFESDLEETYYRRGMKNPPHEFESDDEETDHRHDMKDPPQEFESDEEETDNRHDIKGPPPEFESDVEETDHRHDMKDPPQEFESDEEETDYRYDMKDPPQEFESDEEETDYRHDMKDPPQEFGSDVEETDNRHGTKGPLQELENVKETDNREDVMDPPQEFFTLNTNKRENQPESENSEFNGFEETNCHDVKKLTQDVCSGTKETPPELENSEGTYYWDNTYGEVYVPPGKTYEMVINEYRNDEWERSKREFLKEKFAKMTKEEKENHLREKQRQQRLTEIYGNDPIFWYDIKEPELRPPTTVKVQGNKKSEIIEQEHVERQDGEISYKPVGTASMEAQYVSALPVVEDRKKDSEREPAKAKENEPELERGNFDSTMKMEYRRRTIDVFTDSDDGTMSTGGQRDERKVSEGSVGNAMQMDNHDMESLSKPVSDTNATNFQHDPRCISKDSVDDTMTAEYQYDLGDISEGSVVDAMETFNEHDVMNVLKESGKGTIFNFPKRSQDAPTVLKDYYAVSDISDGPVDGSIGMVNEHGVRSLSKGPTNDDDPYDPSDIPDESVYDPSAMDDPYDPSDIPDESVYDPSAMDDPYDPSDIPDESVYDPNAMEYEYDGGSVSEGSVDEAMEMVNQHAAESSSKCSVQGTMPTKYQPVVSDISDDSVDDVMPMEKQPRVEHRVRDSINVCKQMDSQWYANDLPRGSHSGTKGIESQVNFCLVDIPTTNLISTTMRMAHTGINTHTSALSNMIKVMEQRNSENRQKESKNRQSQMKNQSDSDEIEVLEPEPDYTGFKVPETGLMMKIPPGVEYCEVCQRRCPPQDYIAHLSNHRKCRVCSQLLRNYRTRAMQLHAPPEKDICQGCKENERRILALSRGVQESTSFIPGVGDQQRPPPQQQASSSFQLAGNQPPQQPQASGSFQHSDEIYEELDDEFYDEYYEIDEATGELIIPSDDDTSSDDGTARYMQL